MGVVSFVSVYAVTEASDLTVKETFYAALDSVVNCCPRRGTLLVLRDFNALTGTDGYGYEKHGCPHGSGTRNQNSTKFLDFVRCCGLRVAVSWFQCQKPHHETLCSIAGGVANEIDHVVIYCHWRLLQNCRIHSSARFLNTDHRLVVATPRTLPSKPKLNVLYQIQENVTIQVEAGHWQAQG